MEILSDATFKGNVTIDKSLKSYDLKLSTGQITATNQCAPITLITQAGGYYQFGNTPSDSFLRIGSSGIVTSGSSFEHILNNGSVRIDMPTNSGTIALKSDIPNTSNFINRSDDYCLFGARRFWITTNIDGACTLFKLDSTIANGINDTVSDENVASVQMFKKEVASWNNSTVYKPVEMDVFLSHDTCNGYTFYIQKSSGYSIEANTHYLNYVGFMGGNYNTSHLDNRN